MTNDLSSGAGASRLERDVDDGKRFTDPVESRDGKGVEAICKGCKESGEDRRGVKELRDRRRDLVAEGRGVDSTPFRLARA